MRFSRDVSVYINIDDFLDSCGTRDIEYIIEYLIEGGHINEEALDEKKNITGICEDEFEEALKKLRGKWNMLTKEEENYIVNISKRF